MLLMIMVFDEMRLPVEMIALGYLLLMRTIARRNGTRAGGEDVGLQAWR